MMPKALQPSSVSDLAVEFAEFAATIDATTFEQEVAEAVKMNILDTLACGLAGSSAEAIGDVANLVAQWGGAREASVLVFGGKYPAHHAAMINASMCHARDYDDTHDAAILHAGVTAVAAALAAGELRGGISGTDLMAAVAAGLEVTCRLGAATQVGIVESGWIYTPLLGYFGATAAAGRALGLTANQMLNALGIVYSSVSGNLQVITDASLMKRFQPGLAAQAALVAVQLAQRGLRGVQEVFEGTNGFFRVYLQNRVSADLAREQLGRRFEFLNLSYKPYPSCRCTHAAVDAVLDLRKESTERLGQVEDIKVGLTAAGYQTVCVPEAVRLAPSTVVEAQFSIPFTVAAAWLDGEVGLEQVSSQALTRSDIRSFAPKVHSYVDPEMDREWGRYVTPAAVQIRFDDGTVRSSRVNYMKGHPKNPMSRDDFRQKTRDCADAAEIALPADTVDRLFATIDSLESLDDIATLIGIVSTRE